MITRILTRADPQKLVKHPLSVEVYGDACDEGFDESIARRGVDEPIVVAADNKTIVSGVRRRNGAIKARFDEVPILVRTDLTEQIDIREAIIEANRQNERSVETRAKEFRILKEIEAERAGKRQRAALKKGTSPVRPNSDEGQKGRSDDIAAAQVGMSRDTARKAAEVVDRIEEAHDAGDTETEEDLRETLNKSVAAAHKKVSPPATKKSGSEIDSIKSLFRDLQAPYGILVRGIDKMAKAIGGKGTQHALADQALNDLMGAMKQMREGKQ